MVRPGYPLPVNAEPGRPVLAAGTGADRTAAAAVALIQELQDGLDRHDADITDRHLAAGHNTPIAQ
jgi:hypothetical protein